MEIKLSVLGILLLCTMGAYLLATALLLSGRRGIGRLVFAAGFAMAVAAFAVRWRQVDHLPLQNMFEVLLSMGLLVFPISLFSKRFLKIGDEAVDAILGLIVLFPAEFVRKFSESPEHLPPALQSWLFGPHVAAYMLAYMILAKAAVQALLQLVRSRPGPANPHLVSYETATYRLVCFGFPLLTLGLVLGAVWGKLAWGDYWNWDPKELWSLISWLVYVVYLHVRYILGRRRPRLNSALALCGLAAIIITLLVVNLSRIFGGLHSYAS